MCSAVPNSLQCCCARNSNLDRSSIGEMQVRPPFIVGENIFSRTNTVVSITTYMGFFSKKFLLKYEGQHLTGLGYPGNRWGHFRLNLVKLPGKCFMFILFKHFKVIYGTSAWLPNNIASASTIQPLSLLIYMHIYVNKLSIFKAFKRLFLISIDSDW